MLHADGLGSIALATDATQAIVERSDYSSFGVLTRDGTTVHQPFAYTGREWDGELGLYYYRARYYEPELGRFLSWKPNLHVHAEGDPVNGVSPAGSSVRATIAVRSAQRKLIDDHGLPR